MASEFYLSLSMIFPLFSGARVAVQYKTLVLQGSSYEISHLSTIVNNSGYEMSGK